jgi:hypothetical protein
MRQGRTVSRVAPNENPYHRDESVIKPRAGSHATTDSLWASIPQRRGRSSSAHWIVNSREGRDASSCGSKSAHHDVDAVVARVEAMAASVCESLVAHDEPAKVLEPGKESLDLPPLSVATQRATVLRSVLSGLPMRSDQLHATAPTPASPDPGGMLSA